MINYLLTPIDRHFDLGFGFTGNTFRDAANSLLDNKDEFYFGDPPISYLQRHAIELYIKSGIIILNKLDGNVVDANNDKSFPMIKVDGKEKRLFQVHSISKLFNHLKIELDRMENTLKQMSEMDWGFSDKFVSYISVIDKNDPSSTFFRYPVTKEKGDHIKSPSEPTTQEAMMEKMKSGKGLVKAFVVFDENDEVVDSYELRKSMDKEISEALEYVLNDLYGFHAAMRGELTGGW